MPIINTIGNASGRAYGFTRGGTVPILISATPGPSATITTYSTYIVFKFTSSGTLNVGTGSPGTADVLLVKGGSTGGGRTGTPLGGVGGGGGSVTASPQTAITQNSPIPVVVGGASTDSTFGPLSSSTGSSGGSPGPAGDVNVVGGSGGNGPTNDYLTGSPQYWSGGGGGGGSSGTSGPGSGGQAGGGPGGIFVQRPLPGGGPYATAGTSGTANTGGGGGGSGVGLGGGGGGTGGSGIVIIRFPNLQFRTS